MVNAVNSPRHTTTLSKFVRVKWPSFGGETHFRPSTYAWIYGSLSAELIPIIRPVLGVTVITGRDSPDHPLRRGACRRNWALNSNNEYEVGRHSRFEDHSASRCREVHGGDTELCLSTTNSWCRK
jgi:hypothetical protein